MYDMCDVWCMIVWFIRSIRAAPSLRIKLQFKVKTSGLLVLTKKKRFSDLFMSPSASFTVDFRILVISFKHLMVRLSNIDNMVSVIWEYVLSDILDIVLSWYYMFVLITGLHNSKMMWFHYISTYYLFWYLPSSLIESIFLMIFFFF